MQALNVKPPDISYIRRRMDQAQEQARALLAKLEETK